MSLDAARMQSTRGDLHIFACARAYDQIVRGIAVSKLPTVRRDDTSRCKLPTSEGGSLASSKSDRVTAYATSRTLSLAAHAA